MFKHPLYAELCGEIWAIQAVALQNLLANAAALPIEALALEDKASSASILTIAGDQATIAINGPMLRAGVPLLRYFGVAHTGLDEIGAAMAEVGRRSDLKGLTLAIDSPGGVVTGTPEIAAAIAALPIPVTARSTGMVASAAYWLASQADTIQLGPSALAGSIGVLQVLEDSSAAAAAEGVIVHVVASGPYKGAGIPGSPVSEAHLSDAQRMVDQAAGMFFEAVAAGRGLHPAALATVTTGQVWMGAEAVALGLADQLTTNLAVADTPTVGLAPVATPGTGAKQMTLDEMTAMIAKLEAEKAASNALLAATVASQRASLIGQYASRVVPAMLDAVNAFGDACGHDVAKFEAFLKALPVQIRETAQGAASAPVAVPGPAQPAANSDEQGILRALRALGCQNLGAVAKYVGVQHAYSDGTVVLADGTITSHKALA